MIKWLTGPNFPEVVDGLQNAPGDEIALAAYPMLEERLVLFANSRRSLCPWRGLLCRSSERILCVVFMRFSSTLLIVTVALNPGPVGGEVCSPTHLIVWEPPSVCYSADCKHFTDNSLKREFLP